MTLDDKRAVIEVLLCSSWERKPAASATAVMLGYDSRVRRRASDARVNAATLYYSAGLIGTYSDDCTEAAYRLIESSQTLRREWFGAS
jgi:hypothetical protein